MDKEQRIANDNLKEFIRYSSSPWRIVWTNFVAGIFRGLGTLIGASIVIALFIWMLTLFSDIPMVGKYADEVRAGVSSYIRDTNYNDEFDRLGSTLERIEIELKQD